MIGLPHETLDGMYKTVELNAKVRPDYAWCSLYQPYPNTQLGDYCKTNNLFSGQLDTIKELFSEDTVLDMPEDMKNKIIRLQRLFSLAVEFPLVRKSLPLLIKHGNIDRLTKLRDAWKRHCYAKRIFKWS